MSEPLHPSKQADIFFALRSCEGSACVVEKISLRLLFVEQPCDECGLESILSLEAIWLC